MGAFVLDTSVALKWFLEDETDRIYSLAILGAITDDYRPVVPWLWYYEIASALLIQVEKRKRIAFEKAVLYWNILDEMAIDVDPPNRSVILQVPHIARAHNLTGYDAVFLELAKRLQLPLATNDKALVRAALEYGVELLPMPVTATG